MHRSRYRQLLGQRIFDCASLKKKRLGSAVTEKTEKNAAAHQVAFQRAERSAGRKDDPVGCFFALQRAVAPYLNGCLFPTALFASRLNCRSRGGAEICLVSKRMFIPDGTPVLVTEYYILTRRNIETLNMAVCSATNVESCLCLKVPREFPRVKPLQ